MELNLTLSAVVALFVSLSILAAIPSISVLIVTTRAAVYGFRHGVAVALGLLLVDILFISIALFGMTLLLPWLGKWELLIRLLAAGYLFWLARRIWCGARQQQAHLTHETSVSLKSSFLLGVAVTLADHKAILFYMGFFPAWMDLTQLKLLDIAVIYLLTLFSVGGVKIIYAYLAAKSAKIYLVDQQYRFNKVAAIFILMVAATMLFSMWLN